MKDMNERKKDNAKVMLAGVDLGGNSGLQFNDLTGVISQQIRSIIETRDALIQQNESNGSADAPLTAAAAFRWARRLSHDQQSWLVVRIEARH